jgi:hypothetical protein
MIIFHRPLISRPHLLVAGLILTMPAGYLLWRAHTSKPPASAFAGKQLVLNQGSSVVGDNSTSAGQSIKMIAGGKLTVTVSPPAQASHLTVKARAVAKSCKGNWPAISVSIDGAEVLANTSINSTSWKGYPAPAAFSPPQHALTISYIDADKNASASCTSPIYLDLSSLFSASPASPKPTTADKTSSPAKTAANSPTVSGPPASSPPPSGGGATSSPTTGYGVSVPCDRICYQSAGQKDEELSDIAALGVKWVRLDLRWSVIEDTGPGAANWASFDDTVARASAHGLNVLPILHSTPGWANGGAGGGTPPANVADWTNFVTKAVNHQKANIHYWEIWNEENGTSFFSGSVAQYTTLLKAAYTAIHNNETQAFVISGGMVPQGGDYTALNSEVQWLKGIYANGGKGYFDAVGDHPYIGGGYSASDDVSWSGWYKMARSAESVRSVMVANGDGAKTIWATEWGHHTSGYVPDTSEAQAQANIATDIAVWKSYAWRGVLFYYTDREDGSTGDYGLSQSTYPLAHRPRWVTYQAAIK